MPINLMISRLNFSKAINFKIISNLVIIKMVTNNFKEGNKLFKHINAEAY